jgi:hypothetical protein
MINEEELGRQMKYGVPQLEAEDIINLILFTYGSFNDPVPAINRRIVE